jgi:hypothetical protein
VTGSDDLRCSAAFTLETLWGPSSIASEHRAIFDLFVFLLTPLYSIALDVLSSTIMTDHTQSAPSMFSVERSDAPAKIPGSRRAPKKRTKTGCLSTLR